LDGWVPHLSALALCLQLCKRVLFHSSVNVVLLCQCSGGTSESIFTSGPQRKITSAVAKVITLDGNDSEGVWRAKDIFFTRGDSNNDHSKSNLEPPPPPPGPPTSAKFRLFKNLLFFFVLQEFNTASHCYEEINKAIPEELQIALIPANFNCIHS
jgi:hypothetical protein